MEDPIANNTWIDPRLIEEALEVSGERTKRAAVTRALQEFIARHKQHDILKLMGTLEWDVASEYKKGRSRD